MAKKDVTEVSLGDMLLAQKKAGRKEVVEWVECHRRRGEGFYRNEEFYQFELDEWQEFKKSKGID